MIQFRCWRCHRKYAKDEAKIGEKFTCSCESVLRVPKRTDGNCRVKTFVDRLVEAVVCGGGGAFLGFGLAVLILSRLPIRSWLIIPGLTIAGGIAGLFGGERGIDWIGNMIRDKERH
jgi:hypothetical protein